MRGALICLFTMKTFGVNFLILLALLYENVYNIVAYASSRRKKIFSSMKKCEISRYSFSYTGVIDCTMGGQKLLFYRKKSKNQQTALVVSIAISQQLLKQLLNRSTS